jgi:alkylation response protein AidB-like acyl-CoA dehydrogenase
MHFHPTAEQVAIQDTLKGALADAFPMERLHALADSDADFDMASWDALMALGLGGLALPDSVGGMGLGLVELALAIEALGMGAAPGPFTEHLIAGLAIAASDDAEARTQLEALASGTIVATTAFGDQWLPDKWTARLLDGRLTGEARFVVGATVADLFVVGTSGGGLALARRGESVSVTPVRSTDRSRRLSTVAFENAPAIELLPAGDPAALRIFDAALVLSAADALGGAQRVLDMSVAYAKDREQFGQPIGRFQALKHQLAQMALEVEPSRALVWYSAYAWDARLADSSRIAALAKAHLSDRFVSVARAGVAAHGGIGYTWDYGLAHWFRRSVFNRAWLGSPTVHRARAATLGGW